MDSRQFQGFYESDNSNVGDTRSSTPNSEYCMYDFQEKDLDYNWIPLYYSFVEPWDCELHLKPANLKCISKDTKSVHTAHNESYSNDGVLRKCQKTRRGHAAGKRKRMQVLRRRGQKRLNVNAEVTDQPNAKRARIEDIYIYGRQRSKTTWPPFWAGLMFPVNPRYRMRKSQTVGTGIEEEEDCSLFLT